jgi:hypothetical protein
MPIDQVLFTIYIPTRDFAAKNKKRKMEITSGKEGE